MVDDAGALLPIDAGPPMEVAAAPLLPPVAVPAPVSPPPAVQASDSNLIKRVGAGVGAVALLLLVFGPKRRKKV